MNDMDAAELLDVLDVRELSLLAIAFDMISEVRHTDAARWGRWFRWRVLQALGEHHPQPAYRSLAEMEGTGLEALRRCFLRLAEDFRGDERLCDFAVGVTAEIAIAQHERQAVFEDHRARWQAIVDELRRKRPHGTIRGDT
jgi:hypothetical protein